MGRIHHINDNEKNMLNIMGRNPDTTTKELLNYTTYKWVSTVVRKLNQLKEANILCGPVYDIHYSKLCKNPFHKLVCILESDQSHKTVISYLELIDSLLWIYPVLSPHRELLSVGFFSSDDAKTTALLQLLKDNGIITDYIVRARRCKRLVENPNFFGHHRPSLDTLLDPCELPDMSFGQHDTCWNECDIAILPYISRGIKLMDILRAERKLQRRWTYQEVRYSCEKMVKNGLIEKKYIIYPYPFNKCTSFDLFLRTDHMDLTKRAVYNFAREGRIYREYSLCEDWGMLTCYSHPLFLTDLMYKLDSIEEIKEKELFQGRSISGSYSLARLLDFRYFDVDKQTLEYPYHVYREKIEEKLDSEAVSHMKDMKDFTVISPFQPT